MKKKFTFMILALLALMTSPGWGQTRGSLTLTFDLSSNPGGWPTTNSTTLTDYTYTLDDVDYTFALKNVKCNSGYLMLTQPAALGLPAIENYKLTKVVAKNSSGCSTTTKVGISSSSSSASYISGGEIQTWSTTSSSYTYNLTGTEANTMYYMYVTNKNAQVVELTLTYESTSASTVAAPTFNPAGDTYYEDKFIELSAEEGCTIYYTLNGDTPTAENAEYSAPIQLTVPSTTTIKAIAVDGEGNSSNVASATYTLKRSQYTPAQLLDEVEPDGQQYTVVFTNEIIKNFYVYNHNNAGFYIETTEGDFLVYKSGTPSNWEVGGKVSGTVTAQWKYYNSLKEFCPTSYNNFSYTPPTQQLPTPTGLEVSNLSMTGATLSWNAVEHASSYTVHVMDLEKYENTIEDIENTNVVIDDLTAETEYMWTVQAIGDGETYLNSEIAEGEVFETPTTVLYTVHFEPQQTGGTININPVQAAAGDEVFAMATAAEHYSFTQ